MAILMKQNLMMSTSDLVRLMRRKNTGRALYSPILIDNKPVALAAFLAEDEILDTPLEEALAEKAEDSELPFFYIRYDPDFTQFEVTPGNIHAGFYLSTTKVLTEDGLTELFMYCLNK